MATMPTIKNLSEDVDHDGIMEALHVQEKIARGVQQLDDGQYFTHEQVQARVKAGST